MTKLLKILGIAAVVTIVGAMLVSEWARAGAGATINNAITPVGSG